jgi:signal peptidase I
MSTASGTEALAETPDPSTPRPSGRLLFVAGLLGRTWLWFVGGCLLITLVPILFGWRPFVISSGSMEPRINVGDVVLASPTEDRAALLGNVTVFDVPSQPGVARAHRVIALNGDGSLTTQGDANLTPDSELVAMSDVRGLGRLLVGFAGLPLIWLQTGQWLWLLLFVLSLVVASIVVGRDRDPEVEDLPDDDGSSSGPGGALVPLPTRLSQGSPATIAASRPADPNLRRSRRAAAGPPAGRHMRVAPKPVRRIAYVAVLIGALTVPTANASFAATTGSTANTWATGIWDYSSGVTSLTPWLYWKLDETGTGTSAADSSGNGRTGTYNANGGATYFTKGIVGALTTDTPNRAVTLTNANSCINTTSTTTMNAPAQITEIVWFKTTTTQGGKLVGFEMPRTGVAMPGAGGTYDRHIYMDGAGKVWFGVYNGGYFTISSASTYNDGAWHMAAATMGASGMRLMVDGATVGTNANTTGETTTGWFRAGCGNLGGWGDSWTGPNTPTNSTNPTQNRRFAGSLDEISIWQTELTPAQILALYGAR